MGYDDSLDAFGVHGIGGIIGAIGTGVVASPSLGGTGVWDYVANGVAEFSMSTQVTSQLWGVGVCIVWSGVVSFVAFKIVDLLIGLRMPEEVEREGLDICEHGESAYHNWIVSIIGWAEQKRSPTIQGASMLVGYHCIQPNGTAEARALELRLS